MVVTVKSKGDKVELTINGVSTEYSTFRKATKALDKYAKGQS